MPFVFLFLGIFSFSYWLIATLRYGLSSSLLYVWLLFSLYSFGAFWIGKYAFLLLLPVFLFSLLFLIFLCFSFRAQREKNEDVPDGILVLGIRRDNTLPDSIFQNRVNTARTLLKKYPQTPFVLSGGKVFGEEISEGEMLSLALEEKGFSRNRWQIEEGSRTTVENFRFSAPRFPPACHILVVTSAYHQFRAKQIGESVTEGIRFSFVGAKEKNFLLLHLYLREFVTFSVDLFLGNIKLFRRNQK